MEILAPAHPHALVVAADGAGLVRALEITTNRGVRVVQGARPLPVEARLHRSLISGIADSAVSRELVATGWDGRRIGFKRDGSLAGMLPCKVFL